MKRWACVDVPALPLQLLLQRHPQWREDAVPVVVVDVDKPQGRVVWANRQARACSVRVGMRYAAALAITRELRAGAVDPSECEAAVMAVVQRLQAFSPAIEPSGLPGGEYAELEPGVFWVDASGLDGVFVSLESWAENVRDDLQDSLGLYAAVAVGFSRFGSYAMARHAASVARRGFCVADSYAGERAVTDGVPLDLLQVVPRLRSALDRLGVVDVGGVRRLPEGGLAARFGAAGQALARFVLGGGAGAGDSGAGGGAGGPVDQLTPRVDVERVVRRFEIDPGGVPLQQDALLLLIEEKLGPMCRVLVARGQALSRLDIEVLLEREESAHEFVEPAAPTLDEVQILDLVRLRLERVNFAAEVVGFHLEAVSARATREQLELFAERPRRDLAAAGRALARVRAEFGDEAVVRAVLRDGHLPEAVFGWQAVSQVHVMAAGEVGVRDTGSLDAGADAAMPDAVASSSEGFCGSGSLEGGSPEGGGSGGAGSSLEDTKAVSRGCLVRRILARPEELPRSHHEPDGWFAAGLHSGPIRRTFGPYILSGGWWRHRRRRRPAEGEGSAESGRSAGGDRPVEIHRAYHFVETGRGDVLWVFYDRVRRRWYLHGVVE